MTRSIEDEVTLDHNRNFVEFSPIIPPGEDLETYLPFYYPKVTKYRIAFIEGQEIDQNVIVISSNRIPTPEYKQIFVCVSK